MLADVVRRAGGVPAASFTYDFNGTDTAAGSGVPTPAGNPLLEVVSGSWRRLSNRAHTDTDRNQHPILAVQVGNGDADLAVAVSAGGGDAAYLRVTDVNNWIRARVRTYQGSSTNYYTEYEWSAPYHSATEPVGHSHMRYVWSTSSTVDPTPSSYSHSHDSYGSHTMNRTESGSLTGNTRQGSSTSYYTAYQVILEKRVAGTITNLGTASVSAPSRLRVTGAGSAVAVYVDGSSTAALTATVADFLRVRRHGIGRGPSDQNGHALDNLTISIGGA